MKVGVIADIHSNQTAFRACVDYMVNAGCEEFLLLGDFISDTAGARQTMELLYELMEQFPCHVLRGNREEYMIEQRKIREKEEEEKFWPANSASGNLLYTYSSRKEIWIFLRAFRSRFVMKRKDIRRLPAVTVLRSIQENCSSLTVTAQKRY